jgi:hypothetical protein
MATWSTVSSWEPESRGNWADFGAEARRDVSMKERKSMGKGSFAGKGTSFPINKPEDVAAAAHSLGRAGSDNYSTDQIKANIIRIAKSKGWAGSLPKEWQGGSADSAKRDDDGDDDGNGKPDDDSDDSDGKSSGAFAGAAKPFGKKKKT